MIENTQNVIVDSSNEMTERQNFDNNTGLKCYC